MTKRREVEHHLRQLDDIGQIMRAMKNLAFIETRKLTRLLENQRQLVQEMRRAADDFHTHFPQFNPPPAARPATVIALGSERGFCGDFNEVLAGALDDTAREQDMDVRHVIAVGQRLASALRDDARLIGVHQGPSVAEEIPAAINDLVAVLAERQMAHPDAALAVLHHSAEEHAVTLSALLPIALPGAGADPAPAEPPLLYMTPPRFLADLTDQYLFAALYEVFYASLKAENDRRIQHMQAAVDQLDEKTAELRRKSRTLRQEEITEEIEVILLSAGIGRDGVGDRAR